MNARNCASNGGADGTAGLSGPASPPARCPRTAPLECRHCPAPALREGIDRAGARVIRAARRRQRPARYRPPFGQYLPIETIIAFRTVVPPEVLLHASPPQGTPCFSVAVQCQRPVQGADD